MTITSSADTPMPRFVHFKTPSFMAMFASAPDTGIWINPEQVTSLEATPSGAVIFMADGRSHTVEGAIDEVIKKLSR